jgi:folate-dependent phosphoribosylglycinamide formyltransferase PurN
MKNIVILISGRGSNMEAIVRACAAEAWPARVVAVISNRADAGGLGFARRTASPPPSSSTPDFRRARRSTPGSPKRSTRSRPTSSRSPASCAS